MFYAEAVTRGVLKKSVPKRFGKIHRKTDVPESLLIKLQALAILLEKRLWRRCFPVNFAKFLRKPSLKNNSFTEYFFLQNKLSFILLKIGWPFFNITHGSDTQFC